MDGKNIEKARDILVTKNLKKHFGEVRAVDGVDLKIGEGEITSIVGPNGAGKTTFLRLISGELAPDSGEIIFGGREISDLTIQERTRLGISQSFQVPAVFENMTSLDNLRSSICSREGKRFSFLPISRYSEIKSEAKGRLGQFDLQEGYLAAALPHGARKILDILIAEAQSPKLVLLDEPTSGVSTKDKFELMDSLEPLLEKEKMTVVMVEHDLEIVSDYSDKVAVMSKGRLVQKGDPKKVMKSKKVKEVFGG